MSIPTAERRHFPFAKNGARIRSARRRAGLSQERLAAEAGTTRRHMIRLENGEHLPSRALRDRIVQTTGHNGGEAIESADDEDEEADLPRRRSLSDDLLRLAHVQLLIERSPDRLDGILTQIETTEPTASLAKATVGSDNTGG